MTSRLPLAAFATSLALGGLAGADVIGEDTRRPAGAAELELLSAVGFVSCTKIVDGRRRFARGTATLVGSRRTIVTAAHVLVDEGSRSGGARVEFDVPEDCLFRQYDALGSLVVEARLSRAVIGDFRHNAGMPNEDWAVLVTETPLPPSSVPLRFATMDLADLGADVRLPIEIVAFHADIRELRRTPMHSEGELFGIDYAGFRRLAHTADTGRMSSGAAIVHRTAEGIGIVIGINRSGANFGDFNLAVPLTGTLEMVLRGTIYGEVPRYGESLAAVR